MKKTTLAKTKKNAASRTSSRKTIAKFGETETVSALTPEQEEAYKKGYTLQFVGLASNGIEPRDAMDERANHCMVAGNRSEAGPQAQGTALDWKPCPHFSPKDKYGVPTGEAKKPTANDLFQFTIDGKVRHVQTGLCMRRTTCGASNGVLGPPRPYVYDLGACDEKAVIHIDVEKARANQAFSTLPLGNALNGVSGTCLACGPIKMQQICHGPCDKLEVSTGWTKSPAAYTVQKESPDITHLSFGPFTDGLCKSFVKDDQGIASWWYFHKYDIPAAKGPQKEKKKK